MITLNSKGEPVEIKEIPIDVNALLKKKAELETAIASTPVLKDKPDEETLEFWNGWMKRRIEAKEIYQKTVEEIDAQLKTINELK